MSRVLKGKGDGGTLKRHKVHMHTCVKVSQEHMLGRPRAHTKSIYLGAEWRVICWSCITLLGNANCLSQVVVSIPILTSSGGEFPQLYIFRCPWQSFWLLPLWWTLSAVLNSIPIPLPTFSILLAAFFLFIHRHSLYILGTNPLLGNHGSENIFSPVSGLSCPSLDSSFRCL